MDICGEANSHSEVDSCSVNTPSEPMEDISNEEVTSVCYGFALTLVMQLYLLASPTTILDSNFGPVSFEDIEHVHSP